MEDKEICCSILGDIRLRVDSGVVEPRCDETGLYDTERNEFIVDMDKHLLSNTIILRHIQECRGYGEFLEELLFGQNIENVCITEEHNYFLFCLAVTFESPDIHTYYPNLLNTIPFLRFSMLNACYDLSDKLHWIRMPKSYVCMKAHGKDIKFNNGSSPTPQELMDLPLCFDKFPCFRSLLALETIDFEVRFTDLEKMGNEGAIIPESVQRLCKNISSLTKCRRELLNMVAAEMCYRDIFDPFVEINAEQFYPRGHDNSKGGGVDQLDAPVCNLYISVRAYCGWDSVDDTSWDYSEYRANDLVNAGCIQDCKDLRGYIDFEEFLFLLDEIVAYEAPLFWGAEKLFLRKSNNRAKSARK